jgi:hypothetical protein
MTTKLSLFKFWHAGAFQAREASASGYDDGISYAEVIVWKIAFKYTEAKGGGFMELTQVKKR